LVVFGPLDIRSHEIEGTGKMATVIRA
jgi:hypothetical protein